MKASTILQFAVGLALAIVSFSCSETVLQPTTPTTSEWSTRAPPLAPNSETAVAELDGKIYVIGGYPSTRITVATVQVYDSRMDRWEFAAPLPQGLNHSMAAGVNGKLYVIGGQKGNQSDPAQAGSSGSTIHQVFYANMTCR